MFRLIKENWYLIPVVILILAGLFFIVHRHRKAAREKKERYERQIKDQVLNEALRNNMARHNAFSKSSPAVPMEQEMPGRQKEGDRQGLIFLRLVVKEEQEKSYVLNLQDPIRLGRAPQGNDIVLEGGQVALQHCVFFLYQGHVYVRALSADSLTVLKRKAQQTQVGSTGVQVMTGDRLLIGGIRTWITLMDHVGNEIEG